MVIGKNNVNRRQIQTREKIILYAHANERITEMNSKLNLNEDIIRHLSIKVKKFEETPSPMIKEKE